MLDSLQKGDLVVFEPSLGIAKIERIQGDVAEIRYFDSPTNFVALEKCVPVGHLKKAKIYQETPVYFFDYTSDSWQLGRVLGPDPKGIRVQYPNHEICSHAVADIYVRWNRPLTDPASLLANRINYTPRFLQSRLAFQTEMLKQRRACAGIHAALASSIELEPHQLAVVKRVLSDPVQRYLLADEVGLGKTIEAGLILREHVHENPDTHRVIVLTPPALQHQWREELTNKFHLGELLDVSIHVLSTEQCATAPTELYRADLVIIDEAHQIGAWAWSQTHRSKYAEIVRLCHHSLKLLLLSATPIVGNERNFLGMLHLLDPENYSLTPEGLEAFQQRVLMREEIGGIFHAFNLSNDLFTLEDTLNRLLDLFPGDQYLADQGEKLRPYLDPFAASPMNERDRLIYAIRNYIGNRYRLHHRLLRNRRVNDEVRMLLPGLDGLSRYRYMVEGTHQSVSELLAIWRDGALLADPNSMQLAEVNRMLIEAQLASPNLVAQLAKYRLGETSLSQQAFCYSAQERADLVTNIFSGEVDILHKLVRQAEKEQVLKDSALKSLLHDELKQHSKLGVVIFCDHPWVADQVFLTLMLEFNGKVQRHDPAKEIRFGVDPKCQILVCDRQAEEGVNLHGGQKLALHYDLLFSPNRLEQRLGRLNRYCAGRYAKPVKSLVLVTNETDFRNHWLDILDDVFGLFSQSIASLQYVIDDEMQIVIRDLYPLSQECLYDLAQRLSGENGRLAVERKRIEAQEALMQIDADVREAKTYANALQDIDEQEKCFEKHANDWIESMLRFDREQPKDAPPNSFRYRYNPGVHNTGTLISVQRLKSYCLLGFDFKASVVGVPVTYPLSYRREEISGHIRPARLGEPFHDAILAMLPFEERGIASAAIRVTCGLPLGEVPVFFRFDFLVEADVSSRPLRRLADHLMPPQTFSLWLNASMQQVKGEVELQWLNEPYRSLDKKGHHINLNASNWPLMERYYDAATWRHLCRQASIKSHEWVVEQFADNKATGLKRLEQYLATAALQSATHESTLAVQAELETGLQTPHVTCLAAQALMLATAETLRTGVR